MKLMLNVPIMTWFKPPELGEKPETGFHGENKEFNSVRNCFERIAFLFIRLSNYIDPKFVSIEVGDI